MGLNAAVYCNCYETGRLRIPPPEAAAVYVDDDGGLVCRNTRYFGEFDKWLESDACEHKRREALCHYIGNLALVAFLRAELGKSADSFPLILSKVIYNGMHGGDYIGLGEVERMREEVIRLQDVHSDDPEDEQFLRKFEEQMRGLVACSLEMEKPIVF